MRPARQPDEPRGRDTDGPERPRRLPRSTDFVRELLDDLLLRKEAIGLGLHGLSRASYGRTQSDAAVPEAKDPLFLAFVKLAFPPGLGANWEQSDDGLPSAFQGAMARALRELAEHWDRVVPIIEGTAAGVSVDPLTLWGAWRLLAARFGIVVGAWARYRQLPMPERREPPILLRMKPFAETLRGPLRARLDAIRRGDAASQRAGTAPPRGLGGPTARLAARIGLNPRTLRDWARGASLPDGDGGLVALAEAVAEGSDGDAGALTWRLRWARAIDAIERRFKQQLGDGGDELLHGLREAAIDVAALTWSLLPDSVVTEIGVAVGAAPLDAERFPGLMVWQWGHIARELVAAAAGQRPDEIPPFLRTLRVDGHELLREEALVDPALAQRLREQTLAMIIAGGLDGLAPPGLAHVASFQGLGLAGELHTLANGTWVGRVGFWAGEAALHRRALANDDEHRRLPEEARTQLVRAALLVSMGAETEGAKEVRRADAARILTAHDIRRREGERGLSGYRAAVDAAASTGQELAAEPLAALSESEEPSDRALLGTYYLARRDLPAASKQFLAAMRLGTTPDRYWTPGAILALAAGDVALGVDVLTAIVERRPDAREARLPLAVLLLWGESFPEAERVARRIIEEFPGDGGAWFVLAEALAADGRASDVARNRAAYFGVRSIEQALSPVGRGEESEPTTGGRGV